MTAVRKTGDWALARRLLTGASAKLKTAVGTALRQEAHLLGRPAPARGQQSGDRWHTVSEQTIGEGDLMAESLRAKRAPSQP